MTNEPNPAHLWRGLYSGSAETAFVGAHVIDPSTGQRGQVIELLDERTVLIRLEDGSVVRGRADPTWSAARQRYHAMYRAIEERRARWFDPPFPAPVRLEGVSATGTKTTATLSVTPAQIRTGAGVPKVNVTSDDPATADTGEAAIFFIAFMTGGGWIGSLVHHPLIGGLVGVGVAWHQWRPRS